MMEAEAVGSPLLTPAVFTALISGFFGVLVALGGVWLSRNKTRAEATKLTSERDSVVVSAATDVVALLRNQMQEMNTLLEERDAKIAKLQTELRKNQEALKALKFQVEEAEPLRRQLALVIARNEALEARVLDLESSLAYERQRRGGK